MEFFWEMLSLQETMFLLILTGVLIKKLKIIDAAGRKMLSDLLIDVILPCNIVESFLGGMVFPDGFARNCLLAVGLSAVIQLMSIYGSKLLFRKYPREQRSVLSYGIICSNSSFVGLPVARLLFGDLGVIYTSMFQIPLRFTMWTAGLSLFTSVSRKDAFRKLVRPPLHHRRFRGAAPDGRSGVPAGLPGQRRRLGQQLHRPGLHVRHRDNPGGRPHPLHVLKACSVVHLPAAGPVPASAVRTAQTAPPGHDADQCLYPDDGDARRQHGLYSGGQV